MTLSAASLKPVGLPHNANGTQAFAAANQARAGDPLMASRNRQRESQLNPAKQTEPTQTFGYGDN